MAHDGSSLLSAFSSSSDRADADLSVGSKLSLSQSAGTSSLDDVGLSHTAEVISLAAAPMSFDFKVTTAIETLGAFEAPTLSLDASNGLTPLDGGSGSLNPAVLASLSALDAPTINASLATMSDYLVNGFWNARGQTAHQLNLGSTGNHPTFGQVWYNVSGFSSNLATDYGTEGSDSNGLTAARQQMVREAFKLYSAVLGINFVEVTSTDTNLVSFFFKDNVAGRAYEAEKTDSGTGGMIQYSVINVDSNWSGGVSTIGSYTFQTFLHEIGHGLGLGHQGQYNAGSGNPTYLNSAVYINDSWQQTMMSYWSQTENTEFTDDSYAQLVSPMAVDWIALNTIYSGQGASTANAFTGNTIWGFGTNISSTTSAAFASLATLASTNAFTIVDGGGIDTVDFSNYNANQIIDLYISTTGQTHAWLSSVGGLTKNMTIAVGSIIENATGGGGNDTIYGNDAANVLTGNGGSDYLSSYGGYNTMYGGDGNDTLYSGSDGSSSYGGNGNDYMSSGSGADYMSGGAGTDTVYGGDGNDVMWAYDGAGTNESDLLYGSVGSDYIYVGNGAETVDGGTDTIGGIDTVYSISAADYTFDMATGVTNQAGQVFTGFEVAIMGSGNDTVYTGPGDDTVYGGGGNDLIIGPSPAGGVDYMYGGTGDDTLAGGYFVDFAYGGDGNDVFDQSGAGYVDNVYGGANIDTLDLSGNTYSGFSVNLATQKYDYIPTGFGPYDVVDVENVVGSAFGDVIVGDGGANNLQGGGGDDNLNGGAGTDSLYGGLGNDTLSQNFGGPNEILDGGDGTDTADWSYSFSNWTIDLVAGTANLGGTTYANLTSIENVVGGQSNDVIIGNSGGNVLDGQAGDDYLDGGAGTDSLYGGAGNDTLSQNFGGPNEILNGGDGTDTADWSYSVGNAWTIDLIAGTANIGATTFANLTSIENVVGSQGNDSIHGDNNGNRIDGQGGDDTLNGGSGVDTVFGGDGNDLLVYTSNEFYDQFNGGNGNDTASFDWSNSMTFDLTLQVYAQTDFFGISNFDLISIENIIKTGVSDDFLIGNTVANLLDAGDGNDSISGDAGNDTLIGGAGNDSMYGGTGNDSMVGGAGDDLFLVDNQADIVVEVAGGGTDTVYASASYVLSAAADVEILTTTSIFGVAAINLTGNALSQTIYGNFGVNVLYGGDGNDSIYGFNGADYLYGGTGNDSLVGGADNDLYFVDSAADIVVEVAGGGTADRVLSSVSYVLAAAADIEILSTTSVAGLGAINLTGNALSQTLYGNNGVNALYGGDGNDSIYGFAGADALYGGTGNDSLVGGADNDLYFVDSATDVVVEIAGGGTADRVFTSVNYTLAAGADIEILSTTSVAGFAPISLTGNALSQTIYGNAGANAMYGGDGNDSMYGFDGADTLNGGLGTDSLVGGNDSDWFFVDSQTDVVIELAGGGTADRVFASTSYVLSTTADIEVLSTTSNAGLTAINLTGNGLSQTIYGNDGTNVLNGGGGNDTIYGLGGTDTLNGGTGSDSLNGGLGADAFVFDTALGATNIDTIGNYTVVDDVIRLSSLIFTGLGSGVALAAGAFASNTTGLAVLSTDHIIYQSNTGALFFDVDGFGGVAGKQFATITANLAGFGAGEFFMV